MWIGDTLLDDTLCYHAPRLMQNHLHVGIVETNASMLGLTMRFNTSVAPLAVVVNREEGAVHSWRIV